MTADSDQQDVVLIERRGGVPTGTEPKLSIRLLHRCNFRCPSCSTFSGPDRRGVLRLSDYNRAIEILAAESFRGTINISGGETTLHPDLPKMLAKGARALPETPIAVFTNGSWIGTSRWRDRLRALLAGPNVLVRLSLDRQHAEGLARVTGVAEDPRAVQRIERKRIEQTRRFIESCQELGAQPGRHYDIAFKGDLDEARAYTQSLGPVPLYLIQFRREPDRRSKRFGFFALDVDPEDRVLVFPTLGHIPTGEPLGGLETLREALRLNRAALKENGL
jgi:hypothetical protein